MIDHANIDMLNGAIIAAERVAGRDDNMVQSHFHDFYEVYFLEDGERNYVISDEAFKVKPGDIVLLPPHIMHYSYGDQGKGFCRVLVYFRPEALGQDMYEHLLHTHGVFSLGNNDGSPVLNRILSDLLLECKNGDIYHEEVAASLLTSAMALVLRQGHRGAAESKNSRISHILGYIADHYMEDLNLEVLAEKFYLSKFHLCREFKRHTQTTIAEYVSSIRILNAQRLFMESERSLSEIAEDVGFKSVSSFERAFKKITGETPKERRKHFRKR